MENGKIVLDVTHKYGHAVAPFYRIFFLLSVFPAAAVVVFFIFFFLCSRRSSPQADLISAGFFTKTATPPSSSCSIRVQKFPLSEIVPALSLVRWSFVFLEILGFLEFASLSSILVESEHFLTGSQKPRKMQQPPQMVPVMPSFPPTNITTEQIQKA